MKYLAILFSLAAALCSACADESAVQKAGNQVRSPNDAVNSNTINASASPPAGSFAAKSNQKEIVDMPAANRPPLKYEKAADNSEIATTMNAEGLITEIRVFKKHPHFTKIEAVWMGPKVRALKFQLRNGRIVDVKTERFENLKTAPMLVLMELAGIKPPQPPADPLQKAEKAEPPR